MHYRTPGRFGVCGRIGQLVLEGASKVKEQSKFIVVQCNECGAKSIYGTEDVEMKCKGCKSEDVRVIENPF